MLEFQSIFSIFSRLLEKGKKDEMEKQKLNVNLIICFSLFSYSSHAAAASGKFELPFMSFSFRSVLRLMLQITLNILQPPPPPPGLRPPPDFEKKPLTSKHRETLEKLKSRPRRRPDWSEMMKEVEEIRCGKKLKHVQCNDR